MSEVEEPEVITMSEIRQQQQLKRQLPRRQLHHPHLDRVQTTAGLDGHARSSRTTSWKTMAPLRPSGVKTLIGHQDAVKHVPVRLNP